MAEESSEGIGFKLRLTTALLAIPLKPSVESLSGPPLVLSPRCQVSRWRQQLRQLGQTRTLNRNPRTLLFMHATARGSRNIWARRGQGHEVSDALRVLQVAVAAWSTGSVTHPRVENLRLSRLCPLRSMSEMERCPADDGVNDGDCYPDSGVWACTQNRSNEQWTKRARPLSRPDRAPQGVLRAPPQTLYYPTTCGRAKRHGLAALLRPTDGSSH